MRGSAGHFALARARRYPIHSQQASLPAVDGNHGPCSWTTGGQRRRSPGAGARSVHGDLSTENTAGPHGINNVNV